MVLFTSQILRIASDMFLPIYHVFHKYMIRFSTESSKRKSRKQLLFFIKRSKSVNNSPGNSNLIMSIVFAEFNLLWVTVVQSW